MLFSLHVSQESHQQLDHNGANTDSRSDHARWQRERYLCHLYTNAPPKSKGIGSTWISSTIDLTVIHDIHDTATGAAAKCLYRKHFANLTRNHQNTQRTSPPVCQGASCTCSAVTWNGMLPLTAREWQKTRPVRLEAATIPRVFCFAHPPKTDTAGGSVLPQSSATKNHFF